MSCKPSWGSSTRNSSSSAPGPPWRSASPRWKFPVDSPRSPTLYTASFIAEIVRGGILSVPKGQSEAGYALGLRRGQLLRMVVLPQAFRVILPPLGNQYLNLSKNTSLGIAVAFPEMVQVGQTMFNQTGDTIQVILIWMAFYLSISLLISVLINYYNRRTQLVER